jgi:peptidoglycan/xylan/chitin deacetylase (PgdA/CDA1 family)
VQLSPWPSGARAAVSFSFDWETTMGGLIHSRSLDDPYASEDPQLRGIRMREGITTTLRIFAAYNIRGTYYANGYNFLNGNTEGRTFMGDPTYSWATRENGWQTDTWPTTRWFSADPFGTTATHPAWYFGDLLPQLRAAGQDVQSHTFSHLYAGLAEPEQLRDDFAAWREVAAEQRIRPAQSLAFPWSSSAGMRDVAWSELERAGIRSVTRTNWNPRLPQYHLVDARDPHCRAVPAHPTILACPDFYVTEQRAMLALEQVDRVIAAGGMLDFWTHTEEVTSPGQIAAWGSVVRYAAERRDAGDLWIAPLAELAARQQAVALVRTQTQPVGAALRLVLENTGSTQLNDLTIRLTTPAARIDAPEEIHARLLAPETLLLNLRPGQRVEVLLWPA